MRQILNLDTYPLNQPESTEYRDLVASCKHDLNQQGMFNLHGLMKSQACCRAVDEIAPVMESDSFEHRRSHNIYFLKNIPELASDHPALRQVETVNHTVCADQMEDSIVMKIYQYEPLIRFIAEVMDKPKLYLMDDPLARANVMGYRDGEALNWHFDRSEFTTTLLIQAPDLGGEFEYRSDLRTDDDPNYSGVANLLDNQDSEKQTLRLSSGTLNVFKGKNTAHRVTPVVGKKERLVAVFSYYEFPGKRFSEEELMGFYGRLAD